MVSSSPGIACTASSTISGNPLGCIGSVPRSPAGRPRPRGPADQSLSHKPLPSFDAPLPAVPCVGGPGEPAARLRPEKLREDRKTDGCDSAGRPSWDLRRPRLAASTPGIPNARSGTIAAPERARRLRDPLNHAQVSVKTVAVPSRSSRQSEQIPQVVTTASPDRTRLSQASSRPHQAQTRRKIAERFSPVVRAVTLCCSVGCCRVRGSSSRMGGVLALLAMTRGYAGGAGEILRGFSAFCQ